MPIITIVYGGLLQIVGILAYVLTGARSPTALIPVALGAVAEICGVIALRSEKARKHAMHGAVLIGMLALFGTAPGVPKLLAHLQGQVIERPAAAISMSIVAGLSLVFVLLCVRSFIRARMTTKV